MSIEQFNQLGKVGQGPCQAVDLIDDNDIDLAGLDVIEQLLKGRAVGRSAREPSIVITYLGQRPARMRLAANIGLRSIVLGIK